MRRRGLLALCGLLLLALWPAPVRAGDDDSQLIILNASASGTTLTINGSNFGPGVPVVRLNGANLVVKTASDTKITATLPSLTGGTYLLAVIRNRRSSDRDEDDASRFGAFNLAIGAAGPAGPSGPAGPTGPAGPRVQPVQKAPPGPLARRVRQVPPGRLARPDRWGCRGR